MNEQAPQICIPPIKLRKTKNIDLVDLTKITWENEVRIPEAIITSFTGNAENSWIRLRFGKCRVLQK